MRERVVLDGRSLSLAEVEAVSVDLSGRVGLSDRAREAVARSRAYVEAKVASGERVYGVTTGRRTETSSLAV